MADSDITASGLSAEGAISQIALNWDVSDPLSGGGPGYLSLSAVEVWAASSNDRSLATKIGEGINSFTHAGLSQGASFYYWVKPRSNAGLYGDWFPVSSTDGVNGVEANFDFLLDENGYFKNSNGLIEQWGQATADVSGLIFITFPIPFPSVVLNFCPTTLVSPSQQPVWVILNTLNLSGASITLYVPPPLIVNDILPYLPGSNESISWRALGK